MTEIRPISFGSPQLHQMDRPARSPMAPLVRFGGGDCGDSCDVGHKHDDHDKHEHGKKEPGLVEKWKNKTGNFFSTWHLIQNPITWTLAGIVAGIAISGGALIPFTVPAALLLGIALAPFEGKGLSSEEDKAKPDADKGEGAEKGKEPVKEAPPTGAPEGGEDAKAPANGTGEDAPEVTEPASEAPQVDVLPALPKIELSQAQANAIGRYLRGPAFAHAVNGAFEAGALKLDGNKVVLTDTAYEPDTTSKPVQRAFTLLKGLIAQPQETRDDILGNVTGVTFKTLEFQDETAARERLTGFAHIVRKLSAEGKLLDLVALLNGEKPAENA